MILLWSVSLCVLVALTRRPALRRVPLVNHGPPAPHARSGAPSSRLPLPWLAARRRRPDRSERGLADLVLLFAVGLLSGLSVPLTCRKIVRTIDGPEAAMLASAVERQRRGQPLLDALADAAHTPSGGAMTRMIDLLRSQIEDGAAVADALVELSTSLRDEARREAETQARRLPVRMLLPLITCVLPGFLCLTVAPVIIESLRGVSL